MTAINNILSRSCGGEGEILSTSESWREKIFVTLSFFLIENIPLTALGADDV